MYRPERVSAPGDKPQVVKLGKHFEILCNRGMVRAYRTYIHAEEDEHLRGTVAPVSIEDVVMTEDIYRQNSDLEHVSEDNLSLVMPDIAPSDRIHHILMHGEFSLTTAERREVIKVVRSDIERFLHRYYVSTDNRRPIPIIRIQNALDEMRFKPDLHRSIPRQVTDLLDDFIQKVHVQRMNMDIAVRVPTTKMGQVPRVFSDFSCEVQKENWGSKHYTAVLSIVPGVFEEFSAAMERATEHNFDILVNGDGNPQEEEEQGGRRNGKKRRRKR
ncbi:hypothetical protein PCE1_002596 [Barthelona sp. PCE]